MSRTMMSPPPPATSLHCLPCVPRCDRRHGRLPNQSSIQRNPLQHRIARIADARLMLRMLTALAVVANRGLGLASAFTFLAAGDAGTVNSRCRPSLSPPTRPRGALQAVPSLSSSSSSSSWLSVPDRLGRAEAQILLEHDELLPSRTYGERKTLGLVAMEQECGASSSSAAEGVILADDPRLARTYAEFPLTSLDALLDAAVAYFPPSATDDIRMVDIGSGLGRIVMYTALTRTGRHTEAVRENDNGSSSEHTGKRWEVCGIEISSVLHNKAVELLRNGIEQKLFANESAAPERNELPRNALSLRLGSATDTEGKALLETADLVFAYSTVFNAKHFDPDVGALILDAEEWSKPLGETCKTGCVAVTTDRALDPRFGWKLVQRMDVPNPDVLGTTGFVHVLEGNEAKPN